MFEPLENRQMFSVSTAAVVGITMEWLHTFSETDADGRNVGLLIGGATSNIEAVPGVANADMQTYNDNGVIYWSQSTGAHLVMGGIGQEYAWLAHETDAYGNNVQLLLGLPTSDEGNLSGVAGARTNNFQHGSIDWSASTGAHLLYGAIGGMYVNQGGPTGWLGLPTSDESGPQNDRVSKYQYGYISWSPSGGAVTHETDVFVYNRYGDDLAVEMYGPKATVFVSQTGSSLTIDANGTDIIEPVPAAGLFVYTRGGNNDFVEVDPGVSAFVTIDSIDAAPTSIMSFGTHVITWTDSTDLVAGSMTNHPVASFAGGVSKAYGASLPNPSDTGAIIYGDNSLFGTGPIAADINQTHLGDCYFMATLAAFAQERPGIIENSAVDLGDGTYCVEFNNGGTPEYVRVNNQFSAGNYNGWNYARPGADGSLWGPVFEKAFAYFRDGSNTYASLNNGNPSEAYDDLNVASNTFGSGSPSASQMFSTLTYDLKVGFPVTLCTGGSPPNLVKDHCYTLVSTEVVKGVAEYTVRNPWGFSGDKLENSQGFAMLTYSELVNNFDNVTEAL
jgi:hypothetical protein